MANEKNTEKMKAHYNSIPFFDSDRIQSVSNIASMLVKHMKKLGFLPEDAEEKPIL